MGKIRNLHQENESNQTGRLDLWANDLKDNADMIDALLLENTVMPELKDYREYDALSAWDKLDQNIPHDAENEDLADYQDYDAPKAYAKVEKKLFDTDTVTHQIGQPNKRSFAPLLRIAAVGMVLLLATFGVVNYMNQGGGALTTEMATAKSLYNLPDGSIITLDKGSEIAYHKKGFGDNRVVQFDGRGYFDISKQAGQNFVIESGNLEVEVLGTQFEIDVVNNVKEVRVYEGKVRVAIGGEEIFLLAGEAAIIKNNTLEKQTIDGDLPSWYTGIMAFNDAPITEIVDQIEDHYNIEITMDKVTSNLSCNLNTKIKNETLKSVLEELKIQYGGSYDIKGDQVTLNNMRCK